MDVPQSTEQLINSNTLKFAAGLGIGFSTASSIQLLDEAEKLPGSIGYQRSQPLAAGVGAGALDNYVELESGKKLVETVSNDPGFMAGVATGVYLSEKYFESFSGKYSSDLEKVYRAEDLDELWNDIEEDTEYY